MKTKPKKKNIFRRFISYFKALFLRGLFTILPIILTIALISFTYDIIARWLRPLRNIQPSCFQRIPGTEFIIITLLLLIIGFLVRLFFIMPIVHWFENLITKIPFIRTVYSSSKTLVDFFNVPKKEYNKRKVILMQFPRKGFFNIAFLLGPAADNFQKVIPESEQKPGQNYYKVFMPNSPNPTTGYFFILSEDEIFPTDMTFDEAIKAVVSCGLITPRSIKKL